MRAQLREPAARLKSTTNTAGRVIRWRAWHRGLRGQGVALGSSRDWAATSLYDIG